MNGGVIFVITMASVSVAIVLCYAIVRVLR